MNSARTLKDVQREAEQTFPVAAAAAAADAAYRRSSNCCTPARPVNYIRTVWLEMRPVIDSFNHCMNNKTYLLACLLI